MSRFNNKGVVTVGPKSGVTTTDKRVRNHEGHMGWERGAKGELFLLAASFMGGDDNFYEKSDDRYERLRNLIASEEVFTDPVWIYQFVYWLRHEANMRTVAMVVAIEAVRTRVVLGATDPVEFEPGERLLTNRDIVSAALDRADEPAEALSYWLAKHGKPIPQPVKNGVADAAVRLYNEYSFLKYGESRGAVLTMKDVLRLTHPEPKDAKQNALFEYIVSKDRASTLVLLAHLLPMIRTRQYLYSLDENARFSIQNEEINRAGMTWENVSEWHPGGMSASAWQKIIPSMGIMALIRNLRNFDEAGISRETVREIQRKIADPEVVRKSKQLPFRWYNAYRSVDSVRWGAALDEALTYSLANVPKLKGNTLVLVDMSGSMFASRLSPKSNVTYADAASLFGSALKLVHPNGVELFQFGSEFARLAGGGFYGGYQDSRDRLFSDYKQDERWTGVTKKVDIRQGASVLRAMDKFHDMGGTELHRAVAETVKDYHDRVIILTDEQAWGGSHYDNLPVPAKTPVYIWNFAGYKSAVTPTGNKRRYAFGGLTDSAFRMIPILEAGHNANWPWEVEVNG